jgi:16S rRNA (guanine527-N7)-methyltransferase
MNHLEEKLYEYFSKELNVSRETFIKLQEYVNLLIKWNNSINLISNNDIEDIWTKHILISAELIKYIPNRDIKIVDLGSGSGVPGIILSIMGVKEVVLIEANAKKASFLLQAAQISNGVVKVVNDRIENQQISCDIITSRALASVEKLLEFTKYVDFTDSMILIKGAKVSEEIKLSKNFKFDILDSNYNQNSSVVLVKKLANA